MRVTFYFFPLLLFFIIPQLSFGQYKWESYTGDAEFMSLEDSIDKGRILYHKLAENNSSITGRRGILFNTTLFSFPSLTGSFSWSQVQVNAGRISFYPHIYTFDNGTSALAIAFLYNISRVSPIRGIRTRPSFSPASLLQLERDKMNFSRLKFVSEGFETDLLLQTGNQETDLSLSDFDVNYNYWLKSNPTQKEVAGLRTFFARPLTSFKIRAYSDKGYLDTTLDNSQVKTLSDIFIKTVDLYQRLIDPNYINKLKAEAAAAKSTNTNTNVSAPTNAQTNTNAGAQKVAGTNAQAKKKAPAGGTNKRPVTTQQTNKQKVVSTNKRPKTTRVVTPK
ncbi:MAG: hypothetical protein ACRCWI_04370 [Brevinema sp.]